MEDRSVLYELDEDTDTQVLLPVRVAPQCWTTSRSCLKHGADWWWLIDRRIQMGWQCCDLRIGLVIEGYAHHLGRSNANEWSRSLLEHVDQVDVWALDCHACTGLSARPRCPARNLAILEAADLATPLPGKAAQVREPACQVEQQQHCYDDALHILRVRDREEMVDLVWLQR